MSRACPRSFALCVLALLALGGCGAARSAGGAFASGAITRIQEEDSTLVALQRHLADTAFTILAAEFRGAVLGPATETWSEMRAIARAEADTLGSVFEASLEESLQHSLPEGIETNGALLEAQLRTVVQAFSEEFTVGLARGMQEAIAPAVDSLMRVVVRSTSIGLEEDFAPAAHRLMLGVRDSLEARIGDVDQAVASSQTVSGLRFALLGVGGSLLVGLGIATVAGWRRRTRAFEALLDAIETGGHDGTKRAVAACAREAGVHGWLSDRFRRRWGAVTGEAGRD